MIPFILAAVGGYLIGDSMKEKFADGGEIRRFDRHEQMDSETRGEILDTINQFYLIDGFGNLRNYLYGLFDGYDYSQTDSFKDSMSKLKAKHPSLHTRIQKIYDKIDTYSFTKMADGGYMAKGGKYYAVIDIHGNPRTLEANSKEEMLTKLNQEIGSNTYSLQDLEDSSYNHLISDDWAMVTTDIDIFNTDKNVFNMADGGYMAKGGEIKVGDIVELKNGMKAEVIKRGSDDWKGWVVVKTLKQYGDDTITTRIDMIKKMADGGYMAKGGVTNNWVVTIIYPSDRKITGWSTNDTADISVSASSYDEAKRKGLIQFSKLHPNKKGTVTSVNSMTPNDFDFLKDAKF